MQSLLPLAVMPSDNTSYADIPLHTAAFSPKIVACTPFTAANSLRDLYCNKINFEEAI